MSVDHAWFRKFSVAGEACRVGMGVPEYNVRFTASARFASSKLDDGSFRGPGYAVACCASRRSCTALRLDARSVLCTALGIQGTAAWSPRTRRFTHACLCPSSSCHAVLCCVPFRLGFSHRHPSLLPRTLLGFISPFPLTRQGLSFRRSVPFPSLGNRASFPTRRKRIFQLNPRQKED